VGEDMYKGERRRVGAEVGIERGERSGRGEDRG
jgi:hypothetical protein